MPFKFRLIQRQPLEVRKMMPSTNWPAAHPAYNPYKNTIDHRLTQSLTSRAAGSASFVGNSVRQPKASLKSSPTMAQSLGSRCALHALTSAPAEWACALLGQR